MIARKGSITLLHVTCCVCGNGQRLKNTNQDAAVREAERKGWRQTSFGPICPDCLATIEELRDGQGTNGAASTE